VHFGYILKINTTELPRNWMGECQKEKSRMIGRFLLQVTKKDGVSINTNGGHCGWSRFGG
jgi:hypothetical protein